MKPNDVLTGYYHPEGVPITVSKNNFEASNVPTSKDAPMFYCCRSYPVAHLHPSGYKHTYAITGIGPDWLHSGQRRDLDACECTA